MKAENIHWNAGLYKGKHSFVFKYGEELVSLLSPKPGEKILDLGCGTGELTALIANSGAEVVGLDHSKQMVEDARRSFKGITFIQENGLDYSSPETYDAIFSNAVLHWISPPAHMVKRIAENLKRGGRFVAEFGGKGNTEIMIKALRQSLKARGFEKNGSIDFWYFPSIAEYAGLLEQEGLEVVYATLFKRPTPLAEGRAGMRNWFTMFGEHFFLGLSQEEINGVLVDTENLLVDKHYNENGWTADYKRIRIIAYKS